MQAARGKVLAIVCCVIVLGLVTYVIVAKVRERAEQGRVNAKVEAIRADDGKGY